MKLIVKINMSSILATLFIMCFTLCANAQDFIITGQVTDKEFNEPLIGVNIKQTNANAFAITDMDGNYSISVIGDEAVLEFTYIGMRSLQLRVKKGVDNVLNVVMENETSDIDEVVVVGYGTRKKGTITGSVSVVKSDAFENAPVASFDHALQGKATGLTVLQNSGEPNAPASFQIRGINSINADTEPLFVLDGSPISASDFASINPNDIENISILKDASSTSIYGARAANGVVVITTKRGRAGDKANVTFRAQFGFSNLAYGKWNQMTTSERLDFEEEIGIRIPGKYDREALERININWKDIVFDNNAPTESYEISISGGEKSVNYYFSTGYFAQKGTAVGSDFKRYTLRANMEANATEWLKIGTNTSLTYSQSEETEYGDYSLLAPISASKFMMPYWSPYKEDGSLTSTNDGSWIGSYGNPMEYLAANPLHRNKIHILSSTYFELNPMKDLRLRTMIGIDASDTRSNTTSLPSYPSNYGSGSVGKGYTQLFNLTWTNTANYSFALQKIHNFNLLLGHEVTRNGADSFSVSTRGQSNDKLLTLSTGTTATDWSDNFSASTYVSLFARAEYNLKRNYFLDLSLRRDASSKFGKNNRWANFWSAGFLWDAKLENFLIDVSWLDLAQMSTSYGTSGNSSIPNYDHMPLFAAGPEYAGMTGIAPYTRGNSELTWEKLNTFNLALKLGFIGRIEWNTEFYHKRTTDMLMEVPITLGNGTGMEWDNIGAMVNKGVETSINIHVLQRKDFNWYVDAVASYNHNEITELYNGLDEYEIPGANILLKVGHSYGEHYLVRYAGVNPINGDSWWYTKDGKITNVYNEEDKVLLGKSSVSPWQGGFGTNLSWKGLSINAQFSWVLNRWMVNNDRYFDESNGMYSSAFNQSRELLNRWKNPGDITSVPRYGVTPQIDEHLLEDASFLRLKNLTIGYNLPSNILKQTKCISMARIFAQGQNLLTFTNFSGMDPESSQNVYQAAYPMSRQFTFGLEVNF
ncbi:MAG: TonB-dependent receptor [Bacteroidaceae bacterium]|nr:TonB-dependent receptor [Bacteroidaceae bacterium]